MKVDELNISQKQNKEEHPSVAQRKKLDQARKMRLTQALRENLKKRKEQMRTRKQTLSEADSPQDKKF